MDKIIKIACGGTIDKIYFDAKSDYQIGDPAITEICRRAGVSCHAQSIIRKDSLNLTDMDRKLIVDHILQSPHSRFVITHGTDTMVESALYLHQHLHHDKTVVFVGSFLPAVFRESDADFNVGFALAAATCLPVGVYIAMNGAIFNATDVKKNREKGCFERKQTS